MIHIVGNAAIHSFYHHGGICVFIDISEGFIFYYQFTKLDFETEIFLDKYFNPVKIGNMEADYNTFSKSNLNRTVIDEIHSDYINLNLNDRIVKKIIKSGNTKKLFYF